MNNEGPYKARKQGREGWVSVTGPNVLFDEPEQRADRYVRSLNVAYAAGQSSRWVSVKERLPEVGGWYLAGWTNARGDVESAEACYLPHRRNRSEQWETRHWTYLQPTHWTHKPQPPKESEQTDES